MRPPLHAAAGPGGGGPSDPPLTFTPTQLHAKSLGLTLKNLKLSASESKDGSYLYVEQYATVVLEEVVGESVSLNCVGCHAIIKDSAFAQPAWEHQGAGASAADDKILANLEAHYDKGFASLGVDKDFSPTVRPQRSLDIWYYNHIHA